MSSLLNQVLSIPPMNLERLSLGVATPLYSHPHYKLLPWSPLFCISRATSLLQAIVFPYLDPGKVQGLLTFSHIGDLCQSF